MADIVPNARIVADNAALRATVSASSSVGTFLPGNLIKTGKTLVHRAGGTSVTYTLSWPSAEMIGMVALAFSNLTKNATISVNGVTVQAAQEQEPAPYGFEGLSRVSAKSTYGGGTYATVWFTPSAMSSISLTVDDPGNPDGYIEAGYIIAGNWWTPTRNVSYGASAGVGDNTKNERNDAGDLISDRGPVFKKLTLPFNDFDAADRHALFDILHRNGLSRPFFASLFPDNTDKSVERAHEIYGKLSNLSAVSVANFTSYTTTLEIEEV
jgi:hypothetical protein